MDYAECSMRRRRKIGSDDCMFLWCHHHNIAVFKDYFQNIFRQSRMLACPTQLRTLHTQSRAHLHWKIGSRKTPHYFNRLCHHNYYNRFLSARPGYQFWKSLYFCTQMDSSFHWTSWDQSNLHFRANVPTYQVFTATRGKHILALCPFYPILVFDDSKLWKNT